MNDNDTMSVNISEYHDYLLELALLKVKGLDIPHLETIINIIRTDYKTNDTFIDFTDNGEIIPIK